MKLGEALLQRGVISEIQLKRALDTQMITGGHLGTCLIELGYLDEDRLGEVLAVLLGVPYAHRDLFVDIPASVIATMPAALVEKVRAVPYGLSGRTLHVAMVEPKNLHYLDEIAFVTSCRIQAAIAPEARIFEAMERYYDIPRRMRYITLCRQMDGESRPAAPEPRAAVAAIGAGRPTAPFVATPPPRARGGSAATIEAGFRAPRDPGPSAAPGAGRIEDVAEALCRAEEIDDVARIVVDYASRRMPRAVFFMVRDGRAGVWKSHGLYLEEARLQALSFSVVDEPIFKLPLGEPCYRGLVPADRPYRVFYEKLGLELPTEVLILPLHMNDRLVGIFYGDAVPGRGIQGDVEDYLRVVSKASLGLSIITLKRKLRAL